jgi:hypothetical protein
VVNLQAHPDFPPSNAIAVSVGWNGSAGGVLALAFTVEDWSMVRIPDPAPPVRTDGLWKTTCFELFVWPEGVDGYVEFNFSPSGAWAAYAFDGYRAGMRDLEIAPPVIAFGRGRLEVTLDLAFLPEGACQAGLSAIIQGRDGAKSYWALAHPPGKPDFHHADCFAIELPAASGA